MSSNCSRTLMRLRSASIAPYPWSASGSLQRLLWITLSRTKTRGIPACWAQPGIWWMVQARRGRLALLTSASWPSKAWLSISSLSHTITSASSWKTSLFLRSTSRHKFKRPKSPWPWRRGIGRRTERARITARMGEPPRKLVRKERNPISRSLRWWHWSLQEPLVLFTSNRMWKVHSQPSQTLTGGTSKSFRRFLWIWGFTFLTLSKNSISS